MQYYPSLRELLGNSPKSKQLYDALPPRVQHSLRRYHQSIHTYADLQKILALFL